MSEDKWSSGNGN